MGLPIWHSQHTPVFCLNRSGHRCGSILDLANYDTRLDHPDTAAQSEPGVWQFGPVDNMHVIVLYKTRAPNK